MEYTEKTKEKILARKLKCYNLNPDLIKNIKPLPTPGNLPEEDFITTYEYEGTEFITNGRTFNKTRKEYDYEQKYICER